MRAAKAREYLDRHGQVLNRLRTLQLNGPEPAVSVSLSTSSPQPYPVLSPPTARCLLLDSIITVHIHHYTRPTASPLSFAKVFIARCYEYSADYAVARCPSVCPSHAGDFRPISRFISEMIQDRATRATVDE